MNINKCLTLSTLFNFIYEFPTDYALFIPQDDEWSLEMKCMVLDPEDIKSPVDKVPKLALIHNLIYALPLDDVLGVILNARQQGQAVDTTLFVALLKHYYDNDAFKCFN